LFPTGDYGKFIGRNEPGADFMRTTSIVTVVLAGAIGLASLSPALAAKQKKMTGKMTGACAQPAGRCVSDCDAFHWCAMYTCVNGQSTPVPFWRCFEPSGLCLAPHC
jgi:hypothetical protein